MYEIDIIPEVIVFSKIFTKSVVGAVVVRFTIETGFLGKYWSVGCGCSCLNDTMA